MRHCPLYPQRTFFAFGRVLSQKFTKNSHFAYLASFFLGSWHRAFSPVILLSSSILGIAALILSTLNRHFLHLGTLKSKVYEKFTFLSILFLLSWITGTEPLRRLFCYQGPSLRGKVISRKVVFASHNILEAKERFVPLFRTLSKKIAENGLFFKLFHTSLAKLRLL